MTPVVNISDTDPATTHGENSSYDSLQWNGTAMYPHYLPQVHTFAIMNLLTII